MWLSFLIQSPWKGQGKRIVLHVLRGTILLVTARATPKPSLNKKVITERSLCIGQNEDFAFPKGEAEKSSTALELIHSDVIVLLLLCQKRNSAFTSWSRDLTATATYRTGPQLLVTVTSYNRDLSRL
ncbi:hypothetical protein CEXT_769051 [Caerostris extrusa]|uniref:Uncharacterized protein n=1 Tax=Caerostris extrusa TaxID=172846 RepID=A0AAV4V523_CAEEX|nr:hypothetical protein CEXT_769051 [Caerostris extrusa]